MKTSEEIEKHLRAVEKRLRATRARFTRYDNHDDMDLIPIQEQEVESLRWVLDLPTKRRYHGIREVERE